MPYGRYYTRAATRVSSRALKDTARVGLGVAAAKFASSVVKRAVSGKGTVKAKTKRRAQPRPGKGKHTSVAVGNTGKSKFRSRKTRAISNRLRGVSKSFVKKVEKVIDKNESWGEYMHIGNKQLRQIDRDEWQIESADEFSTAFSLDSLSSIRNAAAVLYNSKDSVNNIDSSTGLIDKATPIKVLYSQIEFFFKSTSSHVVNIELYECTAKASIDSQADARAWAETTFDDYEFSIRRDTAATSNLISRFGVEPRHMTSLQQKFYVKVHNVKLGPGEHSYLKINGMKQKTYDFSNLQSVGSDTARWAKGSKSFFFRIINDVTVSNTINRIHAFPSNDKGGVALRYQTTYRIAPPKMTPNAEVLNIVTPVYSPLSKVRNVVKIHQSYNSGGETDQQITYCNPPGTSTID